MKQYIIKFLGDISTAYSTPFDTEAAAMEFIIDNGYNFKKKETENNGDITLVVSSGKGDYTVIKNHFQKMKEIPGYADNWYANQPKPEDFITEAIANDPEILDDDWDLADEETFKWPKSTEHDDAQDAANWGGKFKDFKDFINKEVKKNKKASKKKAKSSGQIYYIYNKGKLAQKKRFDSMTELSEFIEEKNYFIVALKQISQKTSYIWVVHHDDIIPFLSDSKILKRFEEIIEKRARGFDYSEDNPYEHIEL